MKSLNKFFAVSVLTLVLTQVAVADGIIHGDRTLPPPPPPPSIVAVETPAAAESSEELTATDMAWETVRLALGEMLALY